MLRPLEFRDCVVDGPHFRHALLRHEKELKISSKRIKDVYLSAERLFTVMESVHQAVDEFASTLMNCFTPPDTPPTDSPATTDPPRRSSYSDVSETDDDVTIRAALGDFAQLLQSVEEARSTMLGPIKATVLSEINELRSVWLDGPKTDPKGFTKDTASFCQRLEKYVSLKNKEQAVELDEQMLNERQRFIRRAFEYVTNIHEAEELQKSKFVQTISLLMQVLGSFYHQAFDLFESSHDKMTAINSATQRSAENHHQICMETLFLKQKLLKTPWEIIQSTDASWIREGYLFSPVKKAMTTIWIKNFCVYDRRMKTLTMTPYSQTRSSESPSVETFVIRSCTWRANDSMDRRFCFDVETDKSTTLTLQAQSSGDLGEWLLIMDAKEPPDMTRPVNEDDIDATYLDDRTYEFFCDLIELIEKDYLHEQGIYRVSAQKSKVDPIVRRAMSERDVPLSKLAEMEPYLLAGILSQFIRNLKEPLFTYALHDQFLAAVKCNPSARLSELSRVLRQLPPMNFKFLKTLILHLTRVAAESRQNCMNASNLSIVFAPSLLRSQVQTVAAIMNTKFASLAIELMIENYAILFESDDVSVQLESLKVTEHTVAKTPQTFVPSSSRESTDLSTTPNIHWNLHRRYPHGKFSFGGGTTLSSIVSSDTARGTNSNTTAAVNGAEQTREIPHSQSLYNASTTSQKRRPIQFKPLRTTKNLDSGSPSSFFYSSNLKPPQNKTPSSSLETSPTDECTPVNEAEQAGEIPHSQSLYNTSTTGQKRRPIQFKPLRTTKNPDSGSPSSFFYTFNLKPPQNKTSPRSLETSPTDVCSPQQLTTSGVIASSAPTLAK